MDRKCNEYDIFEVPHKLIQGEELWVTKEWLFNWIRQLNHPDYGLTQIFDPRDLTYRISYHPKTEDEKLRDKVAKLELIIENMRQFGATNVFPHVSYE